MTTTEMMTMTGATTAPATEQEANELCQKCIRIWHKTITEQHASTKPMEQLTI